MKNDFQICLDKIWGIELNRGTAWSLPATLTLEAREEEGAAQAAEEEGGGSLSPSGGTNSKAIWRTTLRSICMQTFSAEVPGIGLTPSLLNAVFVMGFPKRVMQIGTGDC